MKRKPTIVSLAIDGKIGIGTINPKEKLSINGNMRAREIKVETANWPDYVFDSGYKMLSLAEIDHSLKLMDIYLKFLLLPRSKMKDIPWEKWINYLKKNRRINLVAD
ncbi:hypothetical protein [Sphingobacterium cellulitidis]|uniref:Uncharacterized protein n=1 Tax=Sphingobacterium cellulitidis TaxID=1768011 RepID=A0A8H9FZ57_9SPHI|nr:hypothetical protein [Sphingobacterium soli]MBA8986148.1 hypothetical protein [Sphingobacterium soli]GGE17990.1 hypothetical protein GCM10011516_14550 [Sphingobacterium soli]